MHNGDPTSRQNSILAACHLYLIRLGNESPLEKKNTKEDNLALAPVLQRRK